jgi:hypothetical protein
MPPFGELDAWLPRPTVRTNHRRAAAADPDDLWRAAQDVRLSDTRTMGRLVQWRIPGTGPGTSFRDLLASYPFTVLAEGERWSLSGLGGRIWTLARDYPEIHGAEEFRAFREPGTVRVLFAHWVEPAAPGGSTLHSEARVEPVDRHARLALRSVWPVVAMFQRLIAAEPLAVAARRAERAPPARRPSPAQP